MSPRSTTWRDRRGRHREALSGPGENPQLHVQRNDLPPEDRAPQGSPEGVRPGRRGGQTAEGETIRGGACQIPGGGRPGACPGAVSLVDRPRAPDPEGVRRRGERPAAGGAPGRRVFRAAPVARGAGVPEERRATGESWTVPEHGPAPHQAGGGHGVEVLRGGRRT